MQKVIHGFGLETEHAICYYMRCTGPTDSMHSTPRRRHQQSRSHLMSYVPIPKHFWNGTRSSSAPSSRTERTKNSPELVVTVSMISIRRVERYMLISGFGFKKLGQRGDTRHSSPSCCARCPPDCRHDRWDPSLLPPQGPPPIVHAWKQLNTNG